MSLVNSVCSTTGEPWAPAVAAGGLERRTCNEGIHVRAYAVADVVTGRKRDRLDGPAAVPGRKSVVAHEVTDHS